MSYCLLTILCGYVDVEVEAVLALVLDVARRHVQVVCEPHRQHYLWQHPVDVLRAHRGELGGIADLLPGPRSLRWLKATVTDGCCGVGHTEVLLHGAQDLIVQVLLDASELAIAGGYDGVFRRVHLLTGGQAEEQDEAQCTHQAAVCHKSEGARSGRQTPPTLFASS